MGFLYELKDASILASILVLLLHLCQFVAVDQELMKRALVLTAWKSLGSG